MIHLDWNKSQFLGEQIQPRTIIASSAVITEYHPPKKRPHLEQCLGSDRVESFEAPWAQYMDVYSLLCHSNTQQREVHESAALENQNEQSNIMGTIDKELSANIVVVGQQMLKTAVGKTFPAAADAAIGQLFAVAAHMRSETVGSHLDDLKLFHICDDKFLCVAERLLQRSTDGEFNKPHLLSITVNLCYSVVFKRLQNLKSVASRQLFRAVCCLADCKTDTKLENILAVAALTASGSASSPHVFEFVQRMCRQTTGRVKAELLVEALLESRDPFPAISGFLDDALDAGKGKPTIRSIFGQESGVKFMISVVNQSPTPALSPSVVAIVESLRDAVEAADGSCELLKSSSVPNLINSLLSKYHECFLKSPRLVRAGRAVLEKSTSLISQSVQSSLEKIDKS